MNARLLILTLGAIVCLPAQAQDQVVLDSPGTQLNGLIVWGEYSPTAYPKAFKDQPNTANIGNVGPCLLINCKANQVAGFTADRAPAFKKVFPPWTGSSGTLPLTYPQVVEIKTRVWVLCPDPACGSSPLPPVIKDDIVDKLALANALFASQNAGIRLNLTGTDLINDKMDDPRKATYQDFNPSAQDCGSFKGLINGMVDKDAVNLYIVRTVQLQTGRGETCSAAPNVAVFGYTFSSGLVAHEIGHNHSLQHYETNTLGLRNIMHSLNCLQDPVPCAVPPTGVRRYLSEGEVFRMHFDAYSLLNRATKYNNPKAPRPEARYCTGTDQLKPCPSLETRLWDDPL